MHSYTFILQNSYRRMQAVRITRLEKRRLRGTNQEGNKIIRANNPNASERSISPGL
jgi:hypothetical protein